MCISCRKKKFAQLRKAVHLKPLDVWVCRQLNTVLLKTMFRSEKES